MGGRPFGDDVGHDATVVVGGRLEGTVDSSAQVDTVHPHVAGKADVVEVADRLPKLRCKPEEGKGSDRRGYALPRPEGFGSDRAPQSGKLGGSEMGSSPESRFVDAVDRVDAVDLCHQLRPGPRELDHLRWSMPAPRRWR